MMANDKTIIFINNFDSPKRSKVNLKENLSCLESVKLHFCVPFHELPYRIISSLIPPIFGNSYRKIHVDLLGPLLAIFALFILLHYGHANKIPTAVSSLSPFTIVLMYVVVMPILSFIFIRCLGQSRITFIELTSILGYALFGHIFTLTVSLLLYNEESNFLFFVCMLVFGGLSTLKIILILIALIPKPVLRLVICSFVSIMQLLFLITLHFLYMHRSFTYGANKLKF